jgi:tRNA (adenine22-N1)-methyltransferase
VKLGNRLSNLAAMTHGNYDHIWDCCCDHGYLGAHLLSQRPHSTIHFVDIVPMLMTQLEKKLERHLSQYSNRWQVHCLDVAQLPLEQYPGRHLVVIAGIGGELLLTLLQPLLEKIERSQTELLLCPVNHQYGVRHRLRNNGLFLLDERLVVENGRYYELLKLNHQCDNENISVVGRKIWLAENQTQKAVAQTYLTKTLRHYQGLTKNNPNRGATILSAYQEVQITLTPTGD